VQLIADVLDKQIRDVKGAHAGRADGIVLELRADAPPRVAYVEVGPITLLRRFSRRLARWYARIDAKFGDGRGVSYRIPWSRIRHAGVTLELDFDARHTPIFAVERWLRDHVIDHIPGS
jgi:hypothetical protein